MNWNDLSVSARNLMIELGHFGPTVTFKDKQVKGWSRDEDNNTFKSYYSSDDLRQMSLDLKEVAAWLDLRSALPQPELK